MPGSERFSPGLLLLARSSAWANCEVEVESPCQPLDPSIASVGQPGRRRPTDGREPRLVDRPVDDFRPLGLTNLGVWRSCLNRGQWLAVSLDSASPQSLIESEVVVGWGLLVPCVEP